MSGTIFYYLKQFGIFKLNTEYKINENPQIPLYDQLAQKGEKEIGNDRREREKEKGTLGRVNKVQGDLSRKRWELREMRKDFLDLIRWFL